MRTPKYRQKPIYDLRQLPYVLTVDVAARLLNTNESCIRTLLRERRLKGFKVGREWRLNRDDVLSFIGKGGAAWH